MSTPTISDLPGIGELWNGSWEIVVAAYGLFILAGAILVMSHESIQTRYSLKEIAPRIPIAFIASALSLFLVDKIIRLANGLTQGVLGGGVSPPSVGDTMTEAFNNAAAGGLFTILVGLVLVVVGVALLVVYAIRVVITLGLIVCGPLLLICHALPHTDPLARWWWRAIAAALGIQVAQAVVLITAVRTILSGSVHLFGSTLSALGTDQPPSAFGHSEEVRDVLAGPVGGVEPQSHRLRQHVKQAAGEVERQQQPGLGQRLVAVMGGRC
ncbi:hypothetical protein ACFORO_05180 [Amycolatopsis halotolerans]|uniref:TrbL/VirB6 plasmid conjugal transfer protein n=1 Tax=Amycolatopsis halotolerans TaxID=330083 RepID=A0ABV7QB42_9PSEU